jgi:hypothetical protein
MKHTVTFSLVVPASTRSFGDDNWRKTEAAYIDAWKSAVSLLGERNVLFEGISYGVSIDWTPMLHRHERHYSAMTYISKGLSKDPIDVFRRARFPQRSSKILVTAQSSAKGAGNLDGVVESVIHDVFLMMNIAAPGCCNFYRAKLVNEKSTREVSLSSSEFELCVLPSQRRLLTARFVPIDQVVTWYETVRPTVGQIPNSATERAMFALLHLAKVESEMTLSVIWLFYAFESLLQTKVGENFSSIVRRLTLLLGLPNSEIPTMKKQIRILYDLRSSIVHGGFEAIHPMNNESLDKRVEGVFGRLLKANEYGLVVLVAAIQKMVEENWPQLRFEEIIVNEDSAVLARGN